MKNGNFLAVFTAWVLLTYMVVFFTAMFTRDLEQFAQNPWPLTILFLVLSVPVAGTIIEIGKISKN